MKHLRCCAFAVALILAAGSAYAQATRTWVSGVGDDANPCSRLAPCKTFAGAISKTFINGEIDCIDPGGFGAVTITKSITIDCRHVSGSILASATTGIIINIAANTNDPFRSVRIRGLSINGAGASGSVGTRTGIDGIRVIQANSVFVDETVISEFSQDGIDVATTGTTNVFLDDVDILDCSGSGVRFSTSGPSGAIIAALRDVTVRGCSVGLDSAGSARVVVEESSFWLATTGIRTTGAGSFIVGDDLTIVRNGVGVAASVGSIIKLSDSIVASNTSSALNPNGGSITSLQGNSVTFTVGSDTFTLTENKR